MSLTPEEFNLGVKDLLRTPLMRATLHELLCLHIVWEPGQAGSIEVLWRESGMRSIVANSAIRLQNPDRSAFFQMLEEAGHG